MPKKFNILLLTNRDSDNVGDQVIEACDIGLISTVMQNLGLKEDEYAISSRAAAIVTKKYMATRDDSLLDNARHAISKADLVIFGGAPLFNYLYQTFYERTAVTLEIAKQYNKPVIFSAIGVERYDEGNAKCMRLKEALNFDCVKQITTRDNYEYLQKYKANENITIGKVADPAVFTEKIFEKFAGHEECGEKKKIGIFVLRANGFIDNKINFTRDDSIKLCKDIAGKLTEKGYEYEFITSGHFSDEAFMDYMIKNAGVKESKCVFNINTPERLIEKVSSYDGVISCRLHPSIVSYSLGVPSVGIVWNTKVSHFYESIGHPERINYIETISADSVIDDLVRSMEAGDIRDHEYMYTIYTSLFNGIRNVLDRDGAPYTYDELMEKMITFDGTSEKEKDLKLRRKFRRTYNTLNNSYKSISDLKRMQRAISKHGIVYRALRKVYHKITK